MFCCQAIAFAYFETLVRMGDPAKMQSEIERLRSLNNMLDATGQESFMYEDWVEETLNLLEQTATIPSPQQNELALLQAFNNADTANAITQHFRVRLAANHHAYWRNIIVDDPADDYECSAQAESG